MTIETIDVGAAPNDGNGDDLRTAMGKVNGNFAELDRVVGVKARGAVGDGVTDDTAAIAAAITEAKTRDAPKIVIEEGEYLVSSTLTFDLPDNSTIECRGLIKSSVSAAAAIIIGTLSSNTYCLSVHGLKVQRTSTDSAGSSIGVHLAALVGCHIDIRWCVGFYDGVYCNSTSAGFVYNNIHLGYIHDNRNNVHLAASSTGYNNENNFFGGSLNHSSGYPSVQTVNIVIDHFATNPLNNNRFWGPSLEDNDALGIAASIEGENNVIYQPRLENPADQAGYLISFGSNSLECGVIGRGFGLTDGNITDSGSNNNYETREGNHLSYQLADDAALAVLSLQSTTTSAARLLRFLDSSGSVTGFVRGTGAGQLVSMTLTNLYMSSLGNYVNDAAAAVGGVTVGQLYRNGSVVMVRVS